MGKPKTDSGEQKNPSSSGSASDQSAKSSASSKPNPAKLPPAGFIYSDDEDLMDELSMGWGLTASEEQDELDQIINKTVDMSKVSNTKLKALTEPPKGGVERIERVRAERASREIVQPDVQSKQADDRESALKRAKLAAAEKEEATRAAALKEKAEREYAEKQAAEREAAVKARAEEEARQKADEEARAKQEKEDKEQEERNAKEHAEREARDRAAREQEEEEARERAALEARLLKRAEEEARLREEKELKEEAERRAAAKAKEEKDAAEREEAEREIAERQRLQKEAAAKLKARQEEARREAEEAEQREREEQERAAQEEQEPAESKVEESLEQESNEIAAREEEERAEREEQERTEREEQERAKREEKERAEREEKERAEREEKERAEREEKERALKETPAPAVKRFESGKKEIKAQRIGPKTAEEKNPAADKADTQRKSQPKADTKPPEPATAGTTARLSRTPEEELAALLAEDGHDPEPPEEKPKKVEQQDAKTSRSGLAAMEPTDDTPLTGMLKVIKPSEAAKSSGKAAEEKRSQETAEAPAESATAAPETNEAAATSSDSIAAIDKVEVQSASDSEEAGGLLSSEIVGSPAAERSEASSNQSEVVPESKAEPAHDVPDFLKTEVAPKTEEKKTEKTGLAGVDKFYKPERVKLGDFVKKKSEVAEEKPAEKVTNRSEEPDASEEPQKAEKQEKPDKPEKKDLVDQTETKALKILNLPEPAAKSEASGEFGKPSKDEIRESVKSESPEKKAAIIAALKKLEEQVDESDLSSLSTEGLKDVLSKLPDMSGKTTVTGAPAVPGKKEGTRTRMPSPAMARLASAEEPTADRDIAREKLKVMQKMGHTLPELKTYLPQKRALLLIVAAIILAGLAAVMTVRAETISARQALQKKDYNGALSSLGIALALYPLSAEAHFLKGSALYLTGKLDEAYTEYDTALKLSPDMRDALERRAAVSYRLGNYSQSVADYEKVLQQEGEQSQRFDQLLSLANAYLSVGDLQKAADTYNRCLDRKPNYVAAMVGKIAVSNEKKLYERAVIEAGKALAVSPGNKDVLVMRARAYTGMRNFAAAQKDIDNALKKSPKSGAIYAARAHLKLAQRKNADAYADFDKAIKLSGKDAGIYLERAHAYANEQKYDLAAKDIAKARQIMGSQLTADLYVVNAQVQIAGKQAAKALEDLKVAQQKFPNNPDIVLATADALAATGKIGDGIITSEKAMDMDKTYVDAILKHGLLSVKFGNKMRAAADFEEVLKLDPNNLIALKTRGLMFLQQEKYASAQEDLAKVMALDPSQADAKAGLDKARTLFARITRVRSTGIQREGPSDAYLASLAGKPFDTLLNDGYAAYKRGDFQTAVPTLEQAVKINPRDMRGRRYLAYAYKQADQLGEAASQFDALYPSGALSPQDTQIYIEMLLGSGQQDKALKVIEEALAKAPGNQYLYLQMANCQVAQGENQKAIQTCTRGIAISPRTAIAQQLIELRQSLIGGGAGSGNPNGGSIPEPGA